MCRLAPRRRAALLRKVANAYGPVTVRMDISELICSENPGDLKETALKVQLKNDPLDPIVYLAGDMYGPKDHGVGLVFGHQRVLHAQAQGETSITVTLLGECVRPDALPEALIYTFEHEERDRRQVAVVVEEFRDGLWDDDQVMETLDLTEDELDTYHLLLHGSPEIIALLLAPVNLTPLGQDAPSAPTTPGTK